MIRPTLALLLPCCLVALSAEELRSAWFIDGYHGGIYGHYPPGYTAFIVDQLEKHPEWKINLEIEPETWDMVRTSEPQAYAALQKLVAAQPEQRRIEIVNPAYAQSYLFQCSGESVIRQFDTGLRKLHEHFPDFHFTTYSSEEPCFTSCLPQVLRSFGCRFAVLKNPNTCWGGYSSAHGGELVNWIGPDGTSIPAVPRYASEALHLTEPWQTIASGNSPEFIQACFDQGIAHPVGMCLQDAGWRGGPWLDWSAKTHHRPSVSTTWTDYIQNIAAGKSGDDWHFTQEDVKPGLMWGAQILQRIAQQSRHAEHRLLTAEKLAAMALIDAGRPSRTGAFDEAWQDVLLTQHHDCWIVPYNGRPGNTWADQVGRWSNVANSISDLAIETSVEALIRGEGRGRFVRLFNPTASEIEAAVPVAIDRNAAASRWISRDAAGHEFATQLVESPVSGQSQLLIRATLPPMGYATLELRDQAQPAASSVSASTSSDGAILESDLYRIEFDAEKGGTIRSLIAKSDHDREIINSENPCYFNELRGNFYNLGGLQSSTSQPADIHVVENGPLRATVEVLGRIAGNPFTQRISITQGSPVIDCSVRIDWQGSPRIGEFEEKDGWHNARRPAYDDRFKLLALFPTAMDRPQLIKNAPFDVCESKQVDSFYNSWDQIKHNLILDWVDLAENDRGLALFSDHTTSYAYGPGHPLGLTLQYAGKGLWGRDYRIDGPTEVHYALVPHQGNWQEAHIPALSESWQEPALGTLCRAGGSASRALLDPGDSCWQIPAMFQRDGDLYVRLFNGGGDDSARDLGVSFEAGKIEEVELDGRTIRELQPSVDEHGHRSIRMRMPRFGIRTLRFSGIQPGTK